MLAGYSISMLAKGNECGMLVFEDVSDAVLIQVGCTSAWLSCVATTPIR